MSDNATRSAGSSAPACSPDEWRILAIAALNLAGELVAELRQKCNEPLHAMQAKEIANLLKQCTANARHHEPSDSEVS